MTLLLAMGLGTLAVARNADPSTPEAVEDVETLVAELETLNASLATTNDLMSNAIANAAQLSENAQAQLAGLGSRLSDVDTGVGQARSLLGDRLSEEADSELGERLERLRSLQQDLAELAGQLARLQLVRISRDLAAIRDDLGDANRRGSRRARTIAAQIAGLDSRKPDADDLEAQTAALWVEIERQRGRAQKLGASLQNQRELVRMLAAQVRELRAELRRLARP